MSTKHNPNVALILSCDTFEMFFGGVLKLDREKYISTYRNDFSWYYAQGLIENGISPVIYIPSLKSSGIFETDVGVRVRFLPLAWWYLPIAFLRRPMRATRWTLYAQERVNALAFLQPLKEAITTDRIDLVYIQEYWTGRFDHLVHRLRIPVTAADQGGLSKGVLKWFKRKAFQNAASLYCQTVDECSEVKRFGGTPTLQPNGCDTTVFYPPPKGTVREKRIVTVARLTNKQKRTSDLIKAMSLLSEDWRLSIVGVGPDRSMLEALVEKLDLKSRVKFEGFKSRSEIRDLNQMCGVYVMPSSNEAVCLAILEAMGCGSSIVASRIRSFESLIIDGVNGKLFPVGDVKALAEAVEVAWTHRDHFGPAAVEQISNNFDSALLYAKLAESMIEAIRAKSIADAG